MLSERIKNLGISATIAMSAKANELKSSGHKVIDLSLGEPDFFTPDFIKTAAKEAIDNNFSFYPPVSGYLDLRKAITEKLKRENGLDYNEKEIVVSTGAKHSIYNAMMAIINPGDEVLLPAPYWVSYFEIVKMAGGIPVEIPSSIEENYKPSAQKIEKYITPKTKAIMFSSPNNPSGAAFTDEEIIEIANVVEKNNLLVISDEIYEYISYENFPKSIASVGNMKERTIVVNGLSKGFAMTGWRLGYVAAPLEIAKGIEKFQGQVTSATSSITQKAAIAALNGGVNKVKFMVEEFRKRRDYMVGELQKISGFRCNSPEGAFYVFPDVSGFFGKTIKGVKINNTEDLSLLFLDKGFLATVPGGSFGVPNSLRLSYATSLENLKEAINRIENILNN